VEKLKSEIEGLHTLIEKKQKINTRGTTDLFGREFAMPVDAEHKATQVSLACWNIENPHQRAFHTSWFGFFSSFFSMFAAAPLTAYMEKETSLNLTGPNIGTANILAVSSNIVMRVVIGYVCDVIGPRRGLAFLLLISSPAILGMMFVTNATGFIACRTVIGVGLATFVTCQVWCSQMYSKSVVGLANATAAGWGNLGGGVTNLLMPVIFLGFLGVTKGTGAEREDRAWRLCYLVPLCMHILGAIGVLTGRDLPDGNFKELEGAGAKQKSKTSIIVRTGLTNVNAWILTATYGMCFGVELTMNSIAAKYFYNYHGLPVWLAGLLASLYGLMNLFARSLGGLLSDWSNKHYGMRGRIWACWAVQTIEGVMCILMGAVTLGYDAPWKTPKVPGFMLLKKAWVPINATAGGPVMVPQCGAVSMILSPEMQTLYGVDDLPKMVLEPPDARGGAAANCMSHSNSYGLCVFIMILFSLCVQAAEGLHYGIVPYVSRPALGIVSGMVGAGGNLGAVISLRSFFFGAITRTDRGYINLGITVICVTLSMFFIYFPDKGGMLVPAGGLGSYDPQLIKPPADYRGADSMDFAAVQGQGKEDEKKTSTGEQISQA